MLSALGHVTAVLSQQPPLVAAAPAAATSAAWSSLLQGGHGELQAVPGRAEHRRRRRRRLDRPRADMGSSLQGRLSLGRRTGRVQLASGFNSHRIHLLVWSGWVDWETTEALEVATTICWEECEWLQEFHVYTQGAPWGREGGSAQLISTQKLFRDLCYASTSAKIRNCYALWRSLQPPLFLTLFFWRKASLLTFREGAEALICRSGSDVFKTALTENKTLVRLGVYCPHTKTPE